MSFRIRKKHKEWPKEVSEKRVITELLKGNLTGDDEFLKTGSSQWQKIASHPAFYDALLKRLFEGEYHSSESSRIVSDHQARSQSENLPTVQKASGVLPKDDPEFQLDPLATEAIKPNGDRGTQHEAELNELFSSTDINRAEHPGEEKVLEGGEPELHLEIDDPNRQDLPKIDVDIAEDLRSQSELSPKPRGRKRWAILLGVVLLLTLLFQFSGSPPPAKKVAEPAAPQPELYISLTDQKAKRETLESFARQADILYELHTPLFYSGAQEAYVRALQLDEMNVPILGALAETSARLFAESSANEGLDVQVADLVSRGRAKEPHFAAFYRAEALLALYQRKPSGAKEALAHALEVDPVSLENELVKAEVLTDLNELAQAKESIEKVLRADKFNILARHLNAKVAWLTKDYSKAKLESLDVLKLNPLHADSYFILGSVSFAEDRHKEAEQHFITFGGLAKFASRRDLYRAYYRLGVIYENRGQASEANRYYHLARYYFPEGSNELEGKIKGNALSEVELSSLVQKSEYGFNYFRERGEALLSQKNYRQALIFFHAAYLMNQSDASVLVKVGDIADKLADNYVEFRAVSSYYERAIEKSPTYIEAYTRLGLLETDLYNLDRAFSLLSHALNLAPDRAEPHVALGKYYYKSRDYPAAAEAFAQAFKINPADAEIFYYAGKLRALGKAGGEKEAMNYFYRAYLLNSSYYEAMIEWLKLKVKMYDKLFAIKFIRNLLDQDGSNSNLYWALGEVYAANKEHRRAIEYFKKALEFDRYHESVRHSLAKSLEAVGETRAAIDEYRLVTKLNRRNGEGAYRAAELLLEAGQPELAEQVLNDLIALSPKYPGAHRYLARVFQQRRKKDLAIEALRQEVKNNPLNAKFRLDLAGLLIDYQEYDLATKELTDIVNLGEGKHATDYTLDKIRAYLLLSRSYRSLNRLESAEAAINLALAIDGNDPELHRELGYVYYGQQRSKEAVKAFQYYLNRSPAASDGANIRAMIQNMSIDE